MTAPRHDRGASPAGAGWLVTFTDLTILILAFFVLMFSMSTVRKEHWDAMVSSLAASLHPSEDRSTRKVAAPVTIDMAIEAEALDLDYLASVLEEKMRNNAELGRAILHRFDDRLVISLPSDVFFAAGSAALEAPGRGALFVLSGALANIANRVDVQGHNDLQPTDDGRYPSGWELSLARAVAVADELRYSGYGRGLVIQGLGDSRDHGTGQGPGDEPAQPPDRRVDVVIRSTGKRP